jgi:hypothetical protein
MKPIHAAASSAALALLLGGCEGSSAEVASAPAAPVARATAAFWQHWGDGKAELSGYAITTGRYGRPRDGKVVLIYVTEPMDRRVWIKDDDGSVAPADRVNVLKLNHVLKFQTGIYPYSVLTSVFTPVDGSAAERFAPVKISFTAQEWCGSVWQKLSVSPRSFASEIRSYFHAEGEREDTIPTAAGTLYEDALLIQLRELDGPFATGRDWSGEIVPALWSSRKAHIPLKPAPATIRREDALRDGVPVTRFTLAYAGQSRTIDVEKAPPRRVLGWACSDGETARLLKTARLPYWQLHDPGDEKYLAEIGLGGQQPN